MRLGRVWAMRRVLQPAAMWTRIWNWLPAAGQRLLSLLTGAAPREPNQQQPSDLTEFGNAFVVDPERVGGRRRSDIEMLRAFPHLVLADGEDALVPTVPQVLEPPLEPQVLPGIDGLRAHADADASEALRQLNIVLLQGEVVGLLRQIERDEAAMMTRPEAAAPRTEEADRNLLALVTQPVGQPRVASVRLGVPDGGLEASLEAETSHVTRNLKATCTVQ